MNFRPLLLAAAIVAASPAQAQQKLSRYTDDMPPQLQTDSMTVIAYGLGHHVAATICARLGKPMADEVVVELGRWKNRNDAYLQAAGRALDTFAARELDNGGDAARQHYHQTVLAATKGEARKAIQRQFHGADLDNELTPPTAACTGFLRQLRDGTYDFANAPRITQALTVYMQRK
jgi:hypothetical protein